LGLNLVCDCIRMDGYRLIVFLSLCWLFHAVTSGFAYTSLGHHNQDGGWILLSREYLLSLRPSACAPPPDFPNIDWTEYTRSERDNKQYKDRWGRKKTKKRGSRGGVRNRVRTRGSRLPLPQITFFNARSVDNKMTELATLVKYDHDYRSSSLICVTETWLSENKTEIELEGLTTIRYDRDAKGTVKNKGGGLCMFVNNKWATQFTVRERVSTFTKFSLCHSGRSIYHVNLVK
jgi:hypothetical protein